MRDKEMLFNMSAKVKEGYEHNMYNEKYRADGKVTDFEQKCIDIFLEHIKSNGKVLDLGCGAASTYDRYILSQGYNLVGVDFCEAQIERAKKNCPEAAFICEDIMDFKIDTTYDGITMFYSLFHICREQHELLFRRIYKNSSQKCVILLNIRKEDSEGIKEKLNFCNYPMYWSHYNCNVFLDIVKKIGYDFIIIGDEKDYGSSESHLWVLLKK